MNIDPKVAVELLEIIKYLDDELKENIPNNLQLYLENIKDNNYEFKINKNIPLYENEFSKETLDILTNIFENVMKDSE